jgi:glutaconyl-CoA/methylmalonyl-CoA decarboxylase subunit gamma
VRLTVELAGKATVVEVSDDLASVRVGERSYPVKVVAERPLRVELEIDGEAVVVDGWPDHQAEPPGPLDINGERRTVAVRVDPGSAPYSAATRGAPAAEPPPRPGAEPSAAPPAGATAIVPPMPGRVVEVRVREGEAVAKGATLLVVEAMKMRNEVAAPVDGVVQGLRVHEGSSVRARETMLLLVPKGTDGRPS